MRVWILYNDDIESTADLAFEIRRFQQEAKKADIDLHIMKPDSFDLLVTDKELQQSVLSEGDKVDIPDIIFPYFNHNDHSYFSLAVLRQLERMNIPVLNRAQSIETVRDKLHTHQVLAEAGLPTPTTMLAKFPVDMTLIKENIGFPMIVKTLNGALGIGVFLVENEDAFSDLMNLIKETNPNLQLILQEFIAASKGRDARVFVVDGKVVASMKRVAKSGFKANVSQGAEVLPVHLSQRAQEISIETARVLNIEVAGIDLLFLDADEGGDNVTICEANTFPGFKGLEKACDVNVPQEIFAYMRRLIDTT